MKCNCGEVELPSLATTINRPGGVHSSSACSLYQMRTTTERPTGPENPSEARMLVDDLLYRLRCAVENPPSRQNAIVGLEKIKAAILKLEQRP